MRFNDAYLSKREQQIVEQLVLHDRLTANDLMGRLPGPISNSAVRTLLRILEEKGHVRHEEVDGRYVYFVTQDRREAAGGALNNVVATFFRGDVGQAVAALVGDRPEALDAADLDELQRLIDAARRRREGRSGGSAGKEPR